MSGDNKREGRQLKRELKQAGSRRRRAHLKRTLDRDPDEAAAQTDDFDFGRARSADLNGMDHDATRRRGEK